MDDEETKGYRGKWKKVRVDRGNFSLERSDFHFHNVLYEYNGIHKLYESFRPCGPRDILAGWEEGVLEFDLDFSHFAEVGLTSATQQELDRWAEFIEHSEMLDYQPGAKNQETNLILIFLIEFFLCMTDNRDKHRDLLDNMLRCFSRFATSWKVDWRTNLRDLGRMLYFEDRTSGEVLNELLEVFGVKLDL